MSSKPGPKNKEETKKRRDEVLESIEKYGPFSFPAKKLALQHKCTVKVIYNDRDYWIKQIEFKDISLEGKRLLMVVSKNLKIAEKISQTGFIDNRLKALKVINQTTEVFTRLMEQYGFKGKVAEKLEIGGPTKLILEIIDGKIKDEVRTSNEDTSKKH